MNVWVSLAIGIIATLIGSWIIRTKENKGQLRRALSKWTRRGVKVIYIEVQRNADTTSLWLYLCGEEKSWLLRNTSDKDGNSYFLAMKPIYYDSHDHRDEYMAKWEQMDVQPLCDWIKENPVHLVQLSGESKVQFKLNDVDNNEGVIVHDSFKFKDELDECLKKYKVKYHKRETEARNRWKIEPRYPT